MRNATRQRRFPLATRSTVKSQPFRKVSIGLGSNRLGIILSLMTLAAALFADGRTVAADIETLPAGLKVVSMEAYPARIGLQHRFDYRQILITGRSEQGEAIDLTRMAKLTQVPSKVRVSSLGQVRPVADGDDVLVYTFADHSITIPVKVSGAAVSLPPSFVSDVQPAFSRMGCNAGTCHGSKDGKNGFKLSLRGYDSLYDHRAFTDDNGARRFNRAAPDQSLMLLKATGTIPHVGGVRTEVGAPYYELLRQWIVDGTKLDLDAPRVTSIRVLPKNPILPRAGMKQQMVVLATYSDGRIRDVTAEAFVESGDIDRLEADKTGLLTLLRRGEGPVLVRYEGAYAATTITVMGNRDGFQWNEPASNNYVDKLVYAKLQRVKVLPSGVCTDAEFVRRVYLDLTGLLPTLRQWDVFMKDDRDRQIKRDALVDALVGNAEFIEHWTNKWADMLQVNRKFLGESGAAALRNWIKHNIASNRPYDEFAYDVLTGSGSTMENPAAAYYKVLRAPEDAMENTTHLFMAVRFSCNKCHDHPFERWTQDQYYSLASYFAQVGRKEDATFAGKKIGGSAVMGATPLVEVVFDKRSGEIKHDRTGETALPAFPFEHDDRALSTATRREQLARWMTSPKNQYFALSYVNRLWGYLFGIGIIEPIDDIRAGNPPTNPELLDALTTDFVASGFDIQHMFRTMCKSRTYQHSVASNRWNEDDGINYSHALARRLPAEVLYDAIHAACGSTTHISGLPDGMRAAELPDAGLKIPFLDDFGRPARESSCECERSSGIVLGPVMKLVNGPTVANAIADPNNALTKLVANERDDRKVVDQLFQRFLQRHASPEEIELGLNAIAAAAEGHEQVVAALLRYEAKLPARQAKWEKHAVQNVAWTLLDPTEFTSRVGAEFARQDDQSVRVSGKFGKDLYTVVAPTELTGITGVRLEALSDASLPAGGPGRAKNGNFVISEFTLAIATQADPSRTADIRLRNAKASFNQDGWNVTGAVDGNTSSGWAVSPQFDKSHHATFETSEDVGHTGGSILTFKIDQQFTDGLHSLGRFRLSVTTSPRPFGMNSLPANVASSLAVAAAKRSEHQKTTLSNYYQSQDKELGRLRAALQRSSEQVRNKRLIGVQDLAWALINSPAFIFNR